jgi:predicted homoserine dehydrogenase-like protein
MLNRKTRIGLVGTGFIASGLTRLIHSSADFEVSNVLTRRDSNHIDGFNSATLTNSLNKLVDNADIVFESSGDVIHATEAVLAATNAKKKVITINSEFHITTGSFFTRRGDYVTDADGDQPGCLARLNQDVVGMGFKPMAYVNIKGFINHHPERKEMEYWSNLQKLSLEQTVSFTDGTKLQVEQAFVANALGTAIAPGGMTGARVESLSDMDYLVRIAEAANEPISDFVLCKGAPPGVLIVAKSDEADSLGDYTPVKPLRTKEGLAYILLRPYHLCHLEGLNTVRKVMHGEPMLINNSAKPRLTVVAIAKRKISKNEVIERGAGGFDVRGIAVHMQDYKDAVPICLLTHAKVIRDIEPDQIVRFEDVVLDESKALDIYTQILEY